MRRTKRLTAALLILTILGAFLVPGAFAAETLTQRQRALQETAMSFYLSNPYMQYDSTLLTKLDKWTGGIMREENYVTPEDATADHTVYTVCSSFCWEVYYQTFGLNLMDDPLNCTTSKLTESAPAELVVFRQNNEELTDPAERIAGMEKAKSILQTGDLVVCMKGSSGHAMFYAGDINGDGDPVIIHSNGAKYDMENGRDAVEPEGNIVMTSANAYFFNEKGYFYFASPAVDHVTILRPLLAPESKYPLTEAAKARLEHPRIRTERTVSSGAFGSVQTGDTLTYTINITNRSDKDYTAIPVTETVPEGTELVEAKGANVSGKSLKWTVDLKKDTPVTVRYDVKVTAQRGATIAAGGGSVAGVPSNTLKTFVGGKVVDAAKLQAKDYRNAVAQAKPRDTEFADLVYENALGIGLDLPPVREFVNGMLQKEKMTATIMYRWAEPTEATKAFHDMIVPTWCGGQVLYTETSKDRVLECRAKDLQAGDIIIACAIPASSSNATVMVYTGEEMLKMDGSKITAAKDADMVKLLSYDFFVCLRPSLAYDDVTSLVAEKKLPFTDVKEADWFYSFVKELYTAGVVSGMTETTFVPNGQLTYGQALKLIVCGLGKGEQPAGTHWASGYLSYAKNQKWLDKDVDLNANISRLAFCQIAAKAKGLTAQPAANPFTDCADPDVLALVNAGIINGMTATTFAPDSVLTRAQITKIISGLIK